MKATLGPDLEAAKSRGGRYSRIEPSGTQFLCSIRKLTHIGRKQYAKGHAFLALNSCPPSISFLYFCFGQGVDRLFWIFWRRSFLSSARRANANTPMVRLLARYTTKRTPSNLRLLVAQNCRSGRIGRVRHHFTSIRYSRLCFAIPFKRYYSNQISYAIPFWFTWKWYPSPTRFLSSMPNPPPSPVTLTVPIRSSLRLTCMSMPSYGA
jgi:hypothetical protein